MKMSVTSRARAAIDRRSAIYDLYWQFAAERQAIFFRRLEGADFPWTSNEILRTYKFTNVYRASDRVSQFLIRHVIYDASYPTSPEEVVFRTLLFKLFNKESTWQLLNDTVGAPRWETFSLEAYDRSLSAAASRGDRIYSAAYIIPPVALGRSKMKHRGHLRLIDLILRGDFVKKLQQTRNLREVFLLLKSFPSLGNFLAFQLAIDLNYTDIIDHDEGEFVVAGPGAHDGLAKVFPGSSQDDAEVLIAIMMERQQEEFSRLGLKFRSLWGRPLQLIDCQNLFCEISKYTRVSHPKIVGLSGRTRIKQTFKPKGAPEQPWYPPKWGLNDKIPTYTPAINSDLFGAVR